MSSTPVIGVEINNPHRTELSVDSLVYTFIHSVLLDGLGDESSKLDFNQLFHYDFSLRHVLA